jgi:hypothetical protein
MKMHPFSEKQPWNSVFVMKMHPFSEKQPWNSVFNEDACP